MSLRTEETSAQDFAVMVDLNLQKWLQIILGLMLCHYISCDCLLPEYDFPYGTVTSPPDRYERENQTFAKELSLIRFQCSDGYILMGPELLQCVVDEWSSEEPFCSETKCSDPPLVENAISVIDSGANAELVIGSLAVYSCKDGQELVNANASTLRCSVSGESRKPAWEGEMPTCEDKTECADPGKSANGERNGDCCLSGDALSFTCHEGYELVGNRTIHCLRNGVWSSGRPRCRPSTNYCEFPPPIPHGVLTGKKKGDYFAAEEEAEVLCEPGYKCEGNKFVLCEEGGKWEDGFGVCKKIFCSLPAPLANGIIPELMTSYLNVFPYDFEITYVCDEGYRIYSGDSWRTCGKRGWSGKTPLCQVITCPDPGTPDNGIKIGTDYTVGSSVRFGCFRGYELLGSVEMLCSTNGQWSGEVARCNIPSNHCPDPGTPINGFKNMTEYKKGDRVRFRCQAGHILLGSEVRECLPSGNWSGTATKCVGRYDYDNGAHVRDALAVRLAEKKEQQMKELQRFEEAVLAASGLGRMLDIYFPGRIILYFAFDVSGSITLSNFEKSIEFAKAVVRKVGISEHGARAGAVAFGSRAEELFLPLIYNSTEAVVAALDRVTYTGGGTAASSALNWIRMDSMPLVKRWLGDAHIKNVIFVLTDGKANMGGDPKKEALALKADGAEIFCIGITGDVRKSALYDIATESEYAGEKKENVFILQDYKTLGWLVQEITNGTVDYSKCGLGMENIGAQGGRIIGGQESAEPWPWMAALYMGKDKKTMKCGGSIIHPQFILTTAHCLYYKKKKGVYKRKPEEVLVKLGFKSLKDAASLQTFDVRKIHDHEQYRNDVSMDYDIALLELEKPIVYNAYVKPICLPPKVIPEKSKLYKPKTIAWTIGWGHTRVMQKLSRMNIIVSQNLKETAFPIQSEETCTQSLRDDDHLNAFTSRMFCAGSGEGNNDTCKGDSGGPVMQSQISGEGYVEWTQIGLVSWGLGCGLPNQYGFYTHLHELLPWVHSTIELKRGLSGLFPINYSKCGLGMENIGFQDGRIVGGKKSSEPWPWMAALYMGKDEKEMACGGSIIHPQFILTAAHCLYYTEGTLKTKRKRDEIIVRLGLKSLDDTTYLQMLDVRKIHDHDRYRNDRNMDYDIALLELESPIVYNTYVRPICLPPKVIPENSKLYKPQTVAWTVGWGHTKVLNKYTPLLNPVFSTVLKEIALPIQSRETCTESLRDDDRLNDFTERMFCAGSEGGINDTCKRDSGGPIMQSQRNEEGYVEWTQIGVVSWGLGCGLRNEYGFYTHLHELLPWIDNTIEEALKWREE